MNGSTELAGGKGLILVVAFLSELAMLAALAVIGVSCPVAAFRLTGGEVSARRPSDLR
jgi:hypothetical protein